MTADEFRELLGRAGETQSSLAIMLDVARTQVHHWHTGRDDVHPAVAAWLREYAAFVAVHPVPLYWWSSAPWLESAAEFLRAHPIPRRWWRREG